MRRWLAALLLIIILVAFPTKTYAAVDSCATDINADGITDLSDYTAFVSQIFSSNPSIPRADINRDGIVDLTDYSYLVANFFQTCSSKGAFATQNYRNFFVECGATVSQVNNKTNLLWNKLFYGDDNNERVYYPVTVDSQPMAYILDVNNNDVRSEGMSYGMMIAVQMNKKEEFDRLWRWAKKYMYQTTGWFQGYFAWSVQRSGQKNAEGPAPDGEEYFATALIFAHERWGSGSGILDYRTEAQNLLNRMRAVEGPMFHPEHKQILFGPLGNDAPFTDPSYHLPAFYEIWARWDTTAAGRALWSQAATASRTLLKQAATKVPKAGTTNTYTGLMPDYSDFSGNGHISPWGTDGRDFKADAWRTLMNVAVDYYWFELDPWQVTQSDRILTFFSNWGVTAAPSTFKLDGTPIDTYTSVGLRSMIAATTLSASHTKKCDYAKQSLADQLTTGQYRYYDGMLMFLSHLHLSGNFKPYGYFTPTSSSSATSSALPAPQPPTTGAFVSGVYRNMFKELGKTDLEVKAKLDAAWNQLFYGNDSTERVYYPVGVDMAYIKDIGNGDVRSEGMSYGMMIALQMGKKEEFDRLWKWANTYMQHKSGARAGYFAWQCGTGGNIMDPNPASDGEEYFATALFMAAGRWGNGTGIFNYQAEAQKILDTMLHKEDNGIQDSVKNMFNKTHKMVVFVPYASAADFTDPSYHLPAFYELWALWANKDNQFWRDAAATSRAFFRKAAHPTTGLSPNYANFDGTPNYTGLGPKFSFDAWRVAMNVGFDYAWFARDSWQIEFAARLLAFFEQENNRPDKPAGYGNQYELDGRRLSDDHSSGLVSTNAVLALASNESRAWDFVRELWSLSAPSGQWRYYDGMLYLMSLLHVSGNYRIYRPIL